MERSYEETVRSIQQSMSEFARPAFDDSEIEDLRILIRVAIDFHHCLHSIPPWPQFPEDPVHNMTYKLDSVLFNVDSFRRVMHAYGTLVGSTGTTINWDGLTVRSLKSVFASAYTSFLEAATFEAQCRLLLDLTKLQIVFAGASYDCIS